MTALNLSRRLTPARVGVVHNGRPSPGMRLDGHVAASLVGGGRFTVGERTENGWS